MKKRISAFVLFSIISGFAFAGGMNGTYTIDPSKVASGTNFQTFNGAFTQLLKDGTIGNVTFKVADGTYKEEIHLDSFNVDPTSYSSGYPYSNNTNTVLFTSASGDSSKVILVNKTKNKATLNLNYTFYLFFDKLTISNTDTLSIVMNEMDYSGFRNCQLMDGVFFYDNDSLVFLNNQLKNVSMFGDGYSVAPQFIGNHFKNGDLYIIVVGGTTDSLVIDNNIFDNGSVSMDVNSPGGGDALVSYVRNNIMNNASVGLGANAYFENNKVISPNSLLYVGGDEATAALKNNIIVCDIFYTCPPATSRASANFTNNTIIGSTYINGGGGFPDIPVFINNIIDGKITIDNSTPVAGFYSTIQDFYELGQWKNNAYKNPFFHYEAVSPPAPDTSFTVTSIALWQTRSFGADSGSIAANPRFTNSADFIPSNKALDGSALADPSITQDFYHKARGKKPDIGAVEFTASSKTFTVDMATQYITYGPQYYCGGDSTVIGVNVSNNSLSTQTGFDINVSVAGSSSKISYTFKDTLSANADTTVYLGFSPALNTISGGTYNFTAYTTFAKDSNKANDTSGTTLIFNQSVNIKPFATSPISICSAKDTIRLYDSTVLPAGYTRQWNFGDGFYSTSQSVKHVYSKPGKYTIGLYIYGTCSQYASASVLYDTTCVWPGDANRDKVVDASDVLNIGLGFGKTGPARLYATTLWYGQPCTNWKDSFGVGVNYKQADCNGDSTIGYSDTLAITANYSKTHPKTLSRTQGKPTDAPLQIVLNKDSAQAGDVIMADVYLGTKTTNIKNIYGLCFGMNFNSALVDTNSISIDYTSNWFATFNKNQLHFSKDLYGSDRMDFAITRIDHTNASGYGKICSIKMKVSNAVPKAGTKLNFTFSNNKQIDASGKYIPVYMSDDSIIVKQLLTGVENTIPSVSSLNVYPNPFKGFTNIEYSLSRDEKVLVEVFDMTGRRISLLANEEQVSGIHNLKFESNGSGGQYILRIQTGEQVVYKPIMKLNQ